MDYSLLRGHEHEVVHTMGMKVNKAPLKDFEANLTSVHEVFKRCTQALCKNTNSNDDDETGGKLAKEAMEARVRALCETSLFARRVQQCGDEAVSSAGQAYHQGGEPTLASEAFAELMSAASAPAATAAAVESHEFYRKFLLASGTRRTNKSGGAGGGGDEEDIEVMRQDGDEDSELQRFKCPYLQIIMNKPMRNKLCGHVYDETALTPILKTPKCPVRGCKFGVEKANMHPDEDLKYEIEDYQEAAGSSSHKAASASSSRSSSKKKKSRVVQDDDDEEEE